jgi:hypothetical protein
MQQHKRKIKKPVANEQIDERVSNIVFEQSDG